MSDKDDLQCLSNIPLSQSTRRIGIFSYMGVDRRDVTVTVTNWNGMDYLGDCLDAVLAQTVAPAEIILVDNASEDGSVAFVRDRHPDVKVICLDSNEGPCAARNAGMEAATHDLVFAIDNDTVPAPDCLETMLPHLAEDVAIVHPRAVFDGDPDKIHYDGAGMHYVGMMTLRNFYRPVDESEGGVRDVDAAISMALLVDRRKVLEAGGYDPAHFILFEDHDLSYRVRARGHRIVHVASALVRHKEGTEGISFRKSDTYSGKRVFFHSRNHWIVVLKCHGLRAILLGLPGLVLYELSYLFFAIMNCSFLQYMAGKWSLLGLLPHIWRQRRGVQKSRRVPDRRLLGGDPLTVSPLIRRNALVRCMQGGLDVVLGLWWKIVGPLT